MTKMDNRTVDMRLSGSRDGVNEAISRLMRSHNLVIETIVDDDATSERVALLKMKMITSDTTGS